MALLSVIVPLYNQITYIEECVKSIQNQSFQDVEIIIVDDGSTDGSGALADDLVGNDSRIKVIHQENRGLRGARHTGLKNCTSEYITFVDADDFILPVAYSKAVQYMQNSVDMILFEITRYFDENHKTLHSNIFEEGYYDRNRIETVVYPKLIWDFHTESPGIECSQCVRITKRELLLERYDNLAVNLYYGEDMVITYPLYKYIKNMQVISYSYYMHRQHPNCESYIASDSFFDETYKLYKYLMSEFQNEADSSYFGKQIEHLYIYMVELKKKKYNEDYSKIHFLFQFQKVAPDTNVLLYGAGTMGKEFYDQLDRLNYCKNLLWVDKRAGEIKDDRVHHIEEICNFAADTAVIAISDKKICTNVQAFLEENGIQKGKIVSAEE